MPNPNMPNPQGSNFTVRTCLFLPPDIMSGGLIKQFYQQGYKWLDYASPRLQLLIVLIFALTQSLHFVLKRFGLPLFTSQVIAGLLLSRATLPKKMANHLITDENIQLLVCVGDIGYSFFVFLSAVKMDISMAIRVGRKAWYTGFLSVAAPFIYVVSATFLSGGSDKDRISGLFLLPLLFMTSFPVIHVVITELKIINSELGRLASSSAIIADFTSYISVIVLTTMKAAADGTFLISLKGLAFIFLFICLVLLVLRPVMLFLVKLTPEGRPVNQTTLQGVLLLFLAVIMSMPERFTKFWVMVLYLIGLAVPYGPPLGSALVEKFEVMVSAVFLPLFITTCSMRSEKLLPNFRDSKIREKAMMAFTIFFAKMLGCLMPLLYRKMHKHDALVVAAILSSKGVTELAGYSLMFDSKLINADVFSLLVLVLTFMASIVPVLAKKFYDPSRKFAGYQIRKIIDAKPETQLHMIACIHVPSNVSAVLNLLDISCPTTGTPIALSVLHLVKQRGLAAPIFVSHQKQGKNPAYSYSENVVLSFKKFEANHWGAASLDVFTAISPPGYMDDDICTLALDKLASLVILPFHRTWYIDGSLESDDPLMRNLNMKVLEKAPCSVGIIIDRGNIRRPMNPESSANIAMLFLGGRDDREAVTFAYRMAKTNRVNLTVAHFIAKSDHYDVDWELILDSEVLRDIKSNDSITFVKHIVEEGRETVSIIQAMVNDYDLIIVGRRYNVESRQTSGLKEWTEFPELGVLGDLLASKDLTGKYSVLVVQQQAAIH